MSTIEVFGLEVHNLGTVGAGFSDELLVGGIDLRLPKLCN